MSRRIEFEAVKECKTVTVGGIEVRPGEEVIVDLPVADLYTHTQLTLPVHIINSKRPGPTLFLTAALHGDELNGVDVIRRVLRLKELRRLRGCLLAVPIVNVFGFINLSRYLPDRRDLNRSFPGRESGSVAARLAHLVAREIVTKADYGIDLHTGAKDRVNLPQIRGNLSEPKVLELARIFGTPVVINSSLRDGSLREFAHDKGIPMLLYEAGEALRFSPTAIKAGVQGITRVMRALGMLPPRGLKREPLEPVISYSSVWIRAPRSGIVSTRCRLGERVKHEQVIASVSDPFGETQEHVRSETAGIVIGRSNLPLAHEGDALFHVARFDDAQTAESRVQEFRELLSGGGGDPPVEV